MVTGKRRPHRKYLICILSLTILTALFFLSYCQKAKKPERILAHKEPEFLAEPDVFDLVGESIEDLEWSNIAFNTPTSMELNETRKIKLILSMSSPLYDLVQQLEEVVEKLKGENEIVGESIRVSERMEAKLLGLSFEITEVTPALQAVSRIEPTEWIWEIKAKSSGLQTLYLTLSAILSFNGNDAPLKITTFEREIKIKVSFGKKIGTFISNNWQWFCTAIFIPIIVWVFKKWRKKQKKNGEPKKKD